MFTFRTEWHSSLHVTKHAQSNLLSLNGNYAGIDVHVELQMNSIFVYKIVLYICVNCFHHILKDTIDLYSVKES